MNNIGLLNY